MFQGEGYLRFNGKPLSTKEIAERTQMSVKRAAKRLEELEKNGVFSRTDDGTIYSRRIVRDIAKALADQENGRKGGNPALKNGVNPSPNPPHNGEVKARSQSQKSDYKQSSSTTPAGTTTTNLISFQERARANFGGDQAKLNRVIRGVTNAADPTRYLKTCLAEAPAPPDQPAAAVVWIRFGSPAWVAWDAVDPQSALETRSRPGERGRWRPTEFPPALEARA
jgi:DNA-binding Lrp family transcriptional regulator